MDLIRIYGNLDVIKFDKVILILKNFYLLKANNFFEFLKILKIKIKLKYKKTAYIIFTSIIINSIKSKLWELNVINGINNLKIINKKFNLK